MTTAVVGAGSLAALLTTGEARTQQPPQLFPPSSQCMACHNGMVSPSGEARSIGSDWRSSMMANAARDPYWQAAVRRETLDHPMASAAIQDECSKCHMPMARTEAHAGGQQGTIFAHLPIGQGAARANQLAADGVSCSVCHQITDKNLGKRESFVGGFDIDTGKAWGQRLVYGPFEVDRGRTRVMQSASRMRPAQGDHMKDSEVCATCHTLITHSLDGAGNVVGELPEQVPYLEWLHSDYRNRMSCQSCHMPAEQQPMDISSVLGQPRPAVSQHVFRGGNFFMMKVLNRYGAQLGVQALPGELTAGAARTTAHLQSRSASLSLAPVIDQGHLEAAVTVSNLAGHKLPTAYPSRRVWLHVTVTDAASKLLFESGRLAPDGSIQGNANDADPTQFEPHYDRIDQPDQVQIYEPILAGPDGAVTTGLLTATQYLKDNRVLPRGFDKTTAGDDIKVAGKAVGDANFKGSEDRVTYAVAIGDARGPLKIRATLRYQPIGYRWAHNLGSQQSMETTRFVGMYQSLANASSVVLTTVEATVPVP